MSAASGTGTTASAGAFEAVLAQQLALQGAAAPGASGQAALMPGAYGQAASPLTGAAATAQVAGDGGYALAEPLAERFGLSVTSTHRSPEENARVGGSPTSAHLTQGAAADFAGSPEAMRRLAEWAVDSGAFREVFYDPIGRHLDDGRVVSGGIGGHSDHVHITLGAPAAAGTGKGRGMEGLAAIGLNGALSRIEQITGALAGRQGAQVTSGDAAAGAFGDRLAQSAVKALADATPAGDGESADKGSYSASALTGLLSGLGTGGVPGYGAASVSGLGLGGQTTVLSTPTSLTLPAGTAVTLPGAGAARYGGTATGGFGTAGAAGPYTGVGVPTLPLPASANAVGGPGTAGPLGQRLAAIASAELGVAESPPGSNDAPRIAEYRTATVGSSPAPWCAYFCSWVARQAGVPIGEGGRGEGWVPAVKEWGERTGRYIAPGTAPAQAGDLVVFDRGGDGVLDHIGVVTGVAADGSISTVEGNSSDAVSARRYGPGEYAGLVRLVPPGV